VNENWEYLLWWWREIPKNWKVSAAALLVMTAYLILEIIAAF
jgi:hypothetical protein